MANMDCPKCGEKIPARTDACPSCGRSIPEGRRADSASNGTSVSLEASGKKWRVVQFIGKVCIIVWVVLFAVLLYLKPHNAPLLFDIATGLFFGGFILYVVGRIGSW